MPAVTAFNERRPDINKLLKNIGASHKQMIHEEKYKK